MYYLLTFVIALYVDLQDSLHRLVWREKRKDAHDVEIGQTQRLEMAVIYSNRLLG